MPHRLHNLTLQRRLTLKGDIIQKKEKEREGALAREGMLKWQTQTYCNSSKTVVQGISSRWKFTIFEGEKSPVSTATTRLLSVSSVKIPLSSCTILGLLQPDLGYLLPSSSFSLGNFTSKHPTLCSLVTRSGDPLIGMAGVL